jgi:hypothetical protein
VSGQRYVVSMGFQRQASTSTVPRSEFDQVRLLAPCIVTMRTAVACDSAVVVACRVLASLEVYHGLLS